MLWNQYTKADKLRIKQKDRQATVKQLGSIAAILGLGVPTGYGIGKLIQRITNESSFTRSKQFNQMMKDPRLNDDNISEDSIQSIENEYYNKFLIERKQAKHRADSIINANGHINITE